MRALLASKQLNRIVDELGIQPPLADALGHAGEQAVDVVRAGRDGGGLRCMRYFGQQFTSGRYQRPIAPVPNASRFVAYDVQ